jgi:energy-coupling factor transporter ATP-binding protein EcfA2
LIIGFLEGVANMAETEKKPGLVKATTLDMILRSFDASALDFENSSKFYCEDTMIARTGYTDSPIDEICDDFISGTSTSAYLLIGHRGCGKSTELNRLKCALEQIGLPVAVIDCQTKTDLPNIEYWDVLILLMQGLLSIAEQYDCEINEELLREIGNFWDETEIVEEITDSANLDANVGLEAPSPLKKLLGLIAKVQTKLTIGSTIRETVRRKVERKVSTWNNYITIIADTIANKLSQKRPVIVFEDLDKANEKNILDIFSGYSTSLSQFPLNIVYTFPIALVFDARFQTFSRRFQTETLPIISINTKENGSNERGREVMREIIALRSDEGLIDKDARDWLIRKTGGSLRDLFRLTVNAARFARAQNLTSINLDMAKRATTELQTELRRLVTMEHYEFLKMIHKNPTQIPDSELLLKMMMGGIVLEYNGIGWYGLHPLIKDFLIDIGVLSSNETTA